MECKATITNVSRGMKSGFSVMFALEDVSITEIEAIEQTELRMTLVKWREKRSKNANAYFHVLVTKIAGAIGRSVNYVKNDLIAQAGFQVWLDDIPAVIKSNIEPEYMMEQETLHTKVCKVDVDESGTVVYWYRVYRGSHTYDSKEMSRLIDLTVQQANDLDIETLTPDELERIKQEWTAE